MHPVYALCIFLYTITCASISIRIFSITFRSLYGIGPACVTWTVSAHFPATMRISPARSMMRAVRIYGAGILSSHGETIRALEDPGIERLPFDILTCIRTPYRYDIMQYKYFFIQDFDELFSIFYFRYRACCSLRGGNIALRYLLNHNYYAELTRHMMDHYRKKTL